jgi:hypothetical protein
VPPGVPTPCHGGRAPASSRRLAGPFFGFGVASSEPVRGQTRFGPFWTSPSLLSFCLVSFPSRVAKKEERSTNFGGLWNFQVHSASTDVTPSGFGVTPPPRPLHHRLAPGTPHPPPLPTDSGVAHTCPSSGPLSKSFQLFVAGGAEGCSRRPCDCTLAAVSTGAGPMRCRHRHIGGHWKF